MDSDARPGQLGGDRRTLGEDLAAPGRSLIDTAFDLRSDAGGRDPDTYSPTLRRYHKLLWSKPLPGGELFDLYDDKPGVYLYHRSSLGQFVLASDTVIPSLTRWKSMSTITSQFSAAENEDFVRRGYTIGGMIVFPGNQVDGKQTMNAARGLTYKIADRLDLTLECIRRHYLGEDSPLREVISRYADFFALFRDFHGYVDFFLLQDLLTTDRSKIEFFMPFDAFKSPRPRDVAEYAEYRRRSLEFVDARNGRIAQYAATRRVGSQ